MSRILHDAFDAARAHQTGVPTTLFGTDLVHWYLDGYDASGLFYDEIDYANNLGQATPGKRPTVGTVNGHAYPVFDGVSDVLVGPDVTTLDGATELTVFGAFNAGANADYNALFGKAYAGTALWVGVVGGKLVASVGADVGVADAASNASPFDSYWRRFVFVWSAALGGTLYVDGVAQTTTEPAGVTSIPNVAEPLVMGSLAAAGGTPDFGNFVGSLANHGIAIRRATAVEVSELDAYLASYLGIGVDVAGTAAGSTTTTGAISVSRRVAGSTAACATVTPSAGARCSRALAGSASCSTTTSGAVRASRALAGSAAGSTATSGSCSVSRRVAGTCAGATSTTGTPSMGRSVAGSAAGSTTTPSAAIRLTRALSGSVVCSTATPGAAVSTLRGFAGTSTGSTTTPAALANALRALAGDSTGAASTPPAFCYVLRSVGGSCAGSTTTFGTLGEGGQGAEAPAGHLVLSLSRSASYVTPEESRCEVVFSSSVSFVTLERS